jgi:NADH-quinone oxidoreductase subunit E
MFNEKLNTRVNEIIARFPSDKKKSALIAILHEVQDAHQHTLTVELMDKVAEVLSIRPIEVYEVATFYSMYNHKNPGKFMLEFCHTSPCCLRGAEKMMAYTCKKLGVEIGEVTNDGMFSVKGVECLGACGYAPMMQVGDYYYEFLTEEKIDKLIEEFRAIDGDMNNVTPEQNPMLTNA